MASTPVTVSLTLQCHCKAFTLPLALLQSAFPLKSALCHCTICRHSTGQTFATWAVIPLPSPPVEFARDCTGYESSPGLTRYFCRKCGANVGNVEETEWEVSTGMLEFGSPLDDVGGGGEEGGGETQKKAVSRRGPLNGKLDRVMLYIGSSKDGGAVSWLNGGTGDGVKRCMGGRDSQSVTDAMVLAMETTSREAAVGKGDRKMRCHCLCGSVTFTVLRPVEKQEGTRNERYAGNLCGCTSCRKTCGFEITTWISVPESRIRMKDGQDLNLAVMELGHYKSSKGVDRYFCSTCGATVFYKWAQRDTIDIGAGLIDSNLGARAETWVDWNADGDDVHCYEDAVDTEFVMKLVEGIQKATKSK